MHTPSTTTIVQTSSREGDSQNMLAPTNTSQLLTAISARNEPRSKRSKTYAKDISHSRTTKQAGRNTVHIRLQDPYTGARQLKKVVPNSVRFSHSATYKGSHKLDVFVPIHVGKVTSAATNEGNASILAAKREGNLKAVMSLFLSMKRQGDILTYHTYNMVLDAQASLRREGSPIAGLLEGELIHRR